MSSLSESQRLVLATAAGRADGAVLPLPNQLAVRGRARQLVLGGLLKRGLIAERPAQEGDPSWSESGLNQGVTFAITPEGRALIESVDQEPALQDNQPPEPAPAGTGVTAPALEHESTSSGPAVRPGTKQALLVDLLRRPDGATIAEIQQATGWQAHTARAAITGLKKRRFHVVRFSRESGGRAYRLTATNGNDSEGIG